MDVWRNVIRTRIDVYVSKIQTLNDERVALYRNGPEPCNARPGGPHYPGHRISHCEQKAAEYRGRVAELELVEKMIAQVEASRAAAA